MSPRGITYSNKVYKSKTKVEVKVMGVIAQNVFDRLQAFDRYTRLHKTIENA
ncbi:MAG: hypothetical protein ABJQ39_04470 [Winogradskyella arenosi]